MFLLEMIFRSSFSRSSTVMELGDMIYDKRLGNIYDDICITLKAFCCFPVIVAGGERDPSVNNKSTMDQKMLNNIAVLSSKGELPNRGNL